MQPTAFRYVPSAGWLWRSARRFGSNDAIIHSVMRRVIRAAVFDVGDVLFTPQSQADFLARWEQRLCCAPGSLCKVLWHGPDIEAANVGVITAEEYCRRCAARCHIDERMALSLIEDAFSGERLNDDLVSYIQALKPQTKIIALTNNWSFGRRLIERRGITELFDLIITSADEGVRKPHVRIYEIMLERLDVTPAEVVFVDDNVENVEAARNLGIHSIHFRSTEQTISELDKLLVEQR